ncbi:hypothetical protein HQ865_01400 [Mucilaginibacter mali]|uniref:Uncharacterized protein n=1 Tax=Mucilaginibacter mali TaxID=2740462 RepID=A0A7D4QPB8_9SPHI|nr:hypothetical protein [Mucilaginibacter mali]QKJ28469.1 hypothetical protein HQ865_01400 [Mucilaginibacter mali]
MAHLYKQGNILYKVGGNVFTIGDKYVYTGAPQTTTSTNAQRICWDSATNRIYVPNATNGTVQVINGSTFATITTITGIPNATAVSVSNGKMYVLDGNGLLYNYNANTYVLLNTPINIGGGNGISIDPVASHNTAIALKYGSGTNGKAFIINTITDTITGSFQVDTGYCIAHDPILPQYYIVGGSDGRCFTYNSITHTLISTTIWNSFLITSIAFDPITQNNRFLAIQRDGGIYIINNTTLGVIGTIDGIGITYNTSYGIAYDPNPANNLFVACNNLLGKLQVVTQSRI